MENGGTSKAMLTVADLTQLYDDKFSGIRLHDDHDQIYEAVYHFMTNEGKRIRPLLLLCACEMFNGDLENAMNPAFAIQMFHNFTLIHDDIMDEAELRRGIKTVHEIYGKNKAIITGDIVLIIAYKYLAKTDEKNLSALFSLFNKTATQIIEGQQMDMEFESRLDVNEAEYLTMIEYKTSVLLAASLSMGALIANTSLKNRELIYDFGRNLGLAFQLKDDLFDAFSSGSKFGKKIGGDILQNKKTFLLIRALNKADEAQKDKIINLLNCKDPNEKISAMVRLFKELEVDKDIELLMSKYYSAALKSLDKINLGSERKQPLLDLASRIYHRAY